VNDTTFTLLVLLGGAVLLGCVIGGVIAIAATLVSSRSGRNEESGLGDEDVASILGYPMYPVWQAKNGSHKDDEGAAA
jgi:hypothetical protein